LKIDFVLAWVDGSDKEWQKEKAKYCKEGIPGDNREERYRDVVDEYYSFINNYPDTKNRKEADNIFKIAEKHVKN